MLKFLMHKKSPEQSLSELQYELNTLKLNCSSGLTLDQSISFHNKELHVPENLVFLWSLMKTSVRDGKIPASKGVDAVLEMIKVWVFCLKKNKKHTLSSRIQSYIIFFLSLGSIFSVSFILDTPLFSLTNIVSFTLCGIGFFYLENIHRSYKAKLWRLDWLILWKNCATLIGCGQTPLQAMHTSLNHSIDLEKIPLLLLHEASKTYNSINTGMPYKSPSSLKGLNSLDYKILELFLNAKERGIEAKKVVFNYCEQYNEWMIDELETHAQKVAYYSLIPLYVFFAPAIVLSCVGQIFSQIV